MTDIRLVGNDDSDTRTDGLGLAYKSSTSLWTPRTRNTVATAGSSQTLPAYAAIDDLTLSAASCAVTLPTARAGMEFSLIVRQDATGSRLIVWPTTGVLKWNAATAPTLTTTAYGVDVLRFVSDGTSWFGSVASQAANFSGIQYIGERMTYAADSGGTNPAVFTVATAPTPGNTLILTISCVDASATITSVTDSRGNTWTIDISAKDGSNYLAAICSTRQNAAPLQATDTVTVTFNTAPGSGSLLAATLEEFYGLKTAAFLDVTASQATATSGPYPSGTTGATAQAAELAVAVFTLHHPFDPAGTVTYDSSYARFTTSTQYGLGKAVQSVGQYQILTATGAQSCTVAVTGCSDGEGVIATYKAV